MPQITGGIADNLLQSFSTITMKARALTTLKKGVGMTVTGRSRHGEATGVKQGRGTRFQAKTYIIHN